MENETNDDNDNNTAKDNKITKILITISILLFLIIIALGIYFYNLIKPPVNQNINEAMKPIIYIYPQEETNLTVKLGYSENITCSYPKYKDGWNIIAKPNGNLIDLETGRNLYALYWEGLNTENIELDEGFCVKGENSAEFLEQKLSILGLNEREAEEFIVYWLPILENNKYNIIRFATLDEINSYMPLEISEKPDSLIRILMEFKSSNTYVNLPEQHLETPSRNGFVVVEWGGINLDNNIIK